MGIVVYPGTMAGGVTPACNDCGVHLCWDLDNDEYLEAKAFWDAWICEECNGGVRLSLKDWHAKRTAAVGSTPVARHHMTEPKPVPFITYEETEIQEKFRLLEIDRLKAATWEEDADPLVPGEVYSGGDMYTGFFAGKILGRSSNYVAIWSRMAKRVAILPTKDLTDMPQVGTVVAMHAWGSRAVLRRCVPITTGYGWLDAFDDFIVAFQRSDRDWRMSLANDGLCSDIFALNAKGDVASWYRDRVSFPTKTFGDDERDYQ